MFRILGIYQFNADILAPEKLNSLPTILVSLKNTQCVISAIFCFLLIYFSNSSSSPSCSIKGSALVLHKTIGLSAHEQALQAAGAFR